MGLRIALKYLSSFGSRRIRLPSDDSWLYYFGNQLLIYRKIFGHFECRTMRFMPKHQSICNDLDHKIYVELTKFEHNSLPFSVFRRWINDDTTLERCFISLGGKHLHSHFEQINSFPRNLSNTETVEQQISQKNLK